MPRYKVCLLFYSKLIHCLLCVLLTGIKNYRWEVRMVRRIGEVLCLKADSTATWECSTVLSLITISPVVAVNLNTRFSCVNLHCTSTYRLLDTCCKAEFALFLLVEHEAMVIACTVLDLFMVGINILTYSLRCAEVEWCTLTKRTSPVGIDVSSIGR